MKKDAKTAPTASVTEHTTTNGPVHMALSVALFSAVFGLYVKTLFPTVPGGDSGELMAEACHLGVAHPPGYPLFVLIAHAAVKVVPWGSPAWRINLLSAAADAAAACLIAATVKLLHPKRQRLATVAGMTAGALFAFSPLIWLYAVGAEVFSINNFFSALLVWQTVRVAVTRTHASVCVGALLSGLAACNQHTIVLFEAPLILFILISLRKGLSFGRIITYATCYFVGMLPYVFVPLTDSFSPKRGSWGDTSTWHGFWRHFLRKDYGTFRLYAKDTTGPGTMERVGKYATDMATKQLPIGVALFVAVGVLVFLSAWAFRNRSRGHHAAPTTAQALVPASDTAWIKEALVGTYVFYLIVFHFLANMPLDDPLLFGVHARFWQQPHVLACVFLGAGLVSLSTWIDAFVDPPVGGASAQARPSKRAPRRGTRARTIDSSPSKRPSSVAVTALAAVCAVFVAWQVQRNLHVSDHADNNYLERYMRAILEPLPEGSIFVSGYDQQWTVGRYLQDCEGLRPDVTLLNGPVISYDWFEAQRHLYPEIVLPGTHLVGANTRKHLNGGFTMDELITANVDDHAFFVAGGPVFPYEDRHGEMFDEIPHGLVTRIVRKGTMSKEQMVKMVATSWQDAADRLQPNLPDVFKYDLETWESTVRIDFWTHTRAAGEWLLEEALAHDPIDFDRVMLAARMLEGALKHAEEDIPAPFFKNLGLAYARFVQGQGMVSPGVKLAPLPGLEDGASMKQWKELASMRVLTMWERFLSMPSARKDAGYGSIKAVVERLQAAARRQAARGQ